MIGRLLHSTFTTAIKYSNKRFLLTNLNFSSIVQQNYAGFQFLQLQQLHVKVFDKEVGFDNQRESNRYDENESISINHTQKVEDVQKLSKRVPRVRRIVRTETEVDDNVKISDADVFGGARIEEEELDAGDKEEEEFLNRSTRRTKKLQTHQYARLIKEHMNMHRLNDAIAVLEKRMLKEDRVKPENYIYNLLISGCAKAGYTRKAFSLFTKMRQRGLKVTGGTYTSLFNACANAPSIEDGLGRANHLREIMLEKGFEPNLKTYNVMIKAFGRCKDVKTAFLIADEMLDKKLEINIDTINFLLQACASDIQYGFRHCLLTWHKMLQNGLKPDYYTFNTMLRCTRDCEFGDIRSMQNVLQQILEENQAIAISNDVHKNKQLLIESKSSNLESNDLKQSTELEAVPADTNPKEVVAVTNDNPTQLELPNLLALKPHLGSLLTLSEVNKPHERFVLLGGLTGYLEIMKQNNVTPDIKTFTTMLEIIPPTIAAEKQILSFIRRIGLKADIDFFNILIKKRSMRFDYESAKEVLSMLHTVKLQPDIVTYGVLALGCTNEEAARELIQQMHNNGIKMNVEILGAMLRQGCATKNFSYVMDIMQISLDENIKPNEIFLRHLHNFYKHCAKLIDARHPTSKTKTFKKMHSKFCNKLHTYHEELGIAGLKLEDAIKKIKQRPYDQYKE
ncbi:pentatricopeptide repeat-containing protein 1, mitochondrial-like, partial [Teleopsis dalmanni]